MSLLPPPWPPLSPLPPLECTKVTSDGSILKLLVHDPSSSSSEPLPLPHKFARCLIHYMGRILPSSSHQDHQAHATPASLSSPSSPSTTKDDQEAEEIKAPIFMDTRAESPTQQPVLTTCGSASQRESGLSLALATMKRGEMSRVYVLDPKYGYGERGSFSFPAVPPHSRLVYDVELVQWEEEEEGEGEGEASRNSDDQGEPQAPRGLLFEERLERAERQRVMGNKLYSDGKFKDALGKYAVSLSYLDDDMLMQLEGDYLDKAHSLKIPVHLNMAACQLQTGDHKTAIHNCSEVLSIDPGNVKALFRRAKGRKLLGQTEDALKDLEAALANSPDDVAVKKEMAAVKAVRKEEREAGARLFKGAFGPPPPPRPNNGDDTAAREVMDEPGRVVQRDGKSIKIGRSATSTTTMTSRLLAIIYSWTIGWLLVLIFSPQQKKKKD